MTISSEIRVGNSTALGFDTVKVTTTCHGFIDLHVPIPKDAGMDKDRLIIELDRRQLREFLARTMPTFTLSGERYEAETPIPMP